MATAPSSQFGLLLRRSLADLFRNKQFLIARINGALTFALMLGSLDYQAR
jgi:hypothetical protein